MHQYKNVSGLEQVVVGYGIVQADGVLETETPLENPNFLPINVTGEDQPQLPAVSSPAIASSEE